MIKLKPEYLTKNGHREFVVLTMEDFAKVTEALEDAEDLRILRAARADNAGKPTHTLAEVKREPGLTKRGKAGNRRTANSRGIVRAGTR
jgi:hypothetical protein